MKLVLLIVAVVALVAMLGSSLRRWRLRRDDAPPRAKGPSGTSVVAMRACAHCGVHLPESETVKDGELFFCSAAHRQAGPRPPTP